MEQLARGQVFQEILKSQSLSPLFIVTRQLA